MSLSVEYLSEVNSWFNILLTRMKPYLFGNGGPIIMVQVENEYGSFSACDIYYKEWLRNNMGKYNSRYLNLCNITLFISVERHVNNNALLFTTDGPGMLSCGAINGIFSTIDFGAATNITEYWTKQRKQRPKGPLVNSEFYPGWLTHWQEDLQCVDMLEVTETLRLMLEDGASVNFYMFYGGTNFGFTAGANDGGPGHYNVDITSYDYDAPITEAGDPTPKYMAIRDVIAEYLPLPNLTVPVVAPKMSIDPINLNPVSVILSSDGRHNLGTPPIVSSQPLTFEALDQNSGLVLYETILPDASDITRDPALLKIDKLRDRALIYIDRIFIGVLSRENNINSLPVTINHGRVLQILVENQGRINYNIPNDFKGILGNIRLNDEILSNWTITGFPLDDYEKIETLLNEKLQGKQKVRHTNRLQSNSRLIRSGPTIFYTEFEISLEHLLDSYLNVMGWGKGIAYLNGFNLGRYWPVVGPQITLYVPKEVFVRGTNKLVLLEFQYSPENSTVEFIKEPIFRI